MSKLGTAPADALCHRQWGCAPGLGNRAAAVFPLLLRLCRESW